ncbi:MAG: hypothetical protein IJH39_11585 [Clostridia bacterium]|nr:hypothetical protein [Clostridia bacterium]
MEENKQTVENVKVEETGKVDTQSTEKTEEAVKTFTQEEVNSMLKKEKQKAEKKYEGVDIEKYKEWVESQKTVEQKQAEKEAEYKQKDNTISELQKENAVLKAGVKDADDVDYILFKVSKMEGEFEENLAKFLKDNPKYLKGEELNTEPKATGAPVKSLGGSVESGVSAILKAKHPDLYN